MVFLFFSVVVTIRSFKHDIYRQSNLEVLNITFLKMVPFQRISTFVLKHLSLSNFEQVSSYPVW